MSGKLFCLLLLFLSSCAGHNYDYKTFKSCMKSISAISPLPEQVESLSSHSWHAIADYGNGFADHHEWNSYCYFGGRYSLTLVMKVEIDHAKNRIVAIVGEPRFILRVVSKVEHEGYAMSFGNEIEFGKQVWRKGFSNRNDLHKMIAAFGIAHADQKIEGFETFAQRLVPDGRNRITVGGEQRD